VGTDARLADVKVADVTPLVVLRVPVPRTIEPSENVTVPAGNVAIPVEPPAPGTGTTTVAVKVTDWPQTEDGSRLEPSESAVGACLTVWLSDWLVLFPKLPSPP
jgi:hypothetical protein